MNPTPGLGGRPRPKDKRDYQSSSLGMAGLYPDTISAPVPYVYMQGTYGTCGAHAGTALMNVLFPGKIFCPKFLWKIIKTFDGFGLNDGTDMRSIFKALQKPDPSGPDANAIRGVCELSLLDNSLEGSIEQYSDISEVTPTMISNAKQYQIDKYGFIDTPNMAQIKQAISTYKAVLLLVDCGDGWWLPSWGPQNNPLHVGNLVGHHFICATEYGLVIVDGPNSWSVAWGDKGMFNFDASYIPHVLELGFATLPTAPVQYKYNNNLYFGMTNNADVHALQVRLGMPADCQTGNFYWKTMLAVMSYQRSNGISASGFVGPITRTSLNK
jgi:hypothetical protein